MKDNMMTANADDRGSRPCPAGAPPAWVREVLEPDQLAKAKGPLNRQALSRRTMLLLWGLRFYVLLMVILVAVQTWNAFHTGK
jgi:hypothetical protein